MEKKKIICPIHKDNRDPFLDLVCQNKNCKYKGPLCHYCLKDGYHSQHMADDNIELEKFLSKYREDLAHKKSEAEEKYKNLHKDIEEVQKTVNNYIKSINKKLNASFGEMVNDIEDFQKKIEFISSENDVNIFQSRIVNILDESFDFYQNKNFSFNEFKLIEGYLDNMKKCLTTISNYKQNFDIENPLMIHEKKNLVIDDPKRDDEIKNKTKLNIPNISNVNPPIQLNSNNKIESFRYEKMIEIFHEKNEPKKNTEKPTLTSSTTKKIKTDLNINNFENKEVMKEVIRLSDSQDLQEYSYLDINAISFQPNKSVELHGFSHYILSTQNLKAQFEYLLLEGNIVDKLNVLKKGSFELEQTLQKNKEKILFDIFVVLEAKKIYTLKIINKSKTEFKCFKGTNGRQETQDFKFFLSEKTSNKTKLFTNVQSGQIPSLF